MVGKMRENRMNTKSIMAMSYQGGDSPNDRPVRTKEEIEDSIFRGLSEEQKIEVQRASAKIIAGYRERMAKSQED